MLWDGRASRLDIVEHRTDSLSVRLSFVDSTGAAFNVDDWTLSASVLGAAGQTITTIPITRVDASTRIMSLTPAKMRSLTGHLGWALVATRGNQVETWLAGQFTAAPQVDVRRTREATVTVLLGGYNVIVEVAIAPISGGGGGGDWDGGGP